MIILEEEKSFFSQMTEKMIQVEQNGKILLTKFMSLREQAILIDGSKNKAINIQFNGGYPQSERSRAMLYPQGLSPKPTFQIACFQILYNKRYLKLAHNQVLGTLMSLKMDRTLFGDIVFQEESCYFFCAEECEPILKTEFTTIAKVPIQIERVSIDLSVEQKFEVKEVIVPSLRLDAVISHVYHISRELSQSLIEGNMVYRNFQPMTQNAIICQEQDIISVRKYGRFTLNKRLRNTKSDKIVIEINIPTN